MVEVFFFSSQRRVEAFCCPEGTFRENFNFFSLGRTQNIPGTYITYTTLPAHYLLGGMEKGSAVFCAPSKGVGLKFS